jgi:phage-related minor tail protein
MNRPTMFDMGLMGEKTPEAIMPLTDFKGSLGVIGTKGITPKH